MMQPPVPLSNSHLIADFDCGVESLNDWLRKRAWKNQASNVSRTYVVCKEKNIIGYYCLSSAAIDREDMPKSQQRNMPDPIPAVLIGRLAVDLKYKGRGIGAGLLQDALVRIVTASQTVGIAYILVRALDVEAKRFYEKYGFVAIPEETLTLFLPVATALAALR
jgi:predicted N-acetyltransferase YhbS